MKEIKLMKKLKLTKDEKNYMNQTFGKFLPPTFIDFLAGYRFNPKEVKVRLDKNNKLDIRIEGYWHNSILWEVPIMAIVSEVYNRHNNRIIVTKNIEIYSYVMVTGHGDYKLP
jgi:nicotinate phosphoribosyltransferase